MSLREFLTIIFRQKILIITIFCITIISSYVKQELQTSGYYSSVRMLVSGTMQSDLTYIRSLGPGSLIETQMALVTSKPVLDRVVNALELYAKPLDYEKRFASRLKAALITYRTKNLTHLTEKMTPEERHAFLFERALGELRNRIRVDGPEEGTSLFRIIVSDYDPDMAIKLANVISRSYIMFDLEHQIAELKLIYGEKNVTIQKLENLIENLEQYLDGRLLSDFEALGPASVKIISQARLALPVVSKTGKGKLILISIIMSTLMGIIVAFTIEYLNPTFKSPYEVERMLNVPFLGSIPKIKSKDNLLITEHTPTTKYKVSFQDVSEDVYILSKDRNIKSILITDTRVSHETSAVIFNFATFFAQKLKQKVLIIDANIKAPTFYKLLNISNNPGLIDLIEGKEKLDNIVHNIDANIDVVTSGGSLQHSSAILECSKMAEIIEYGKNNYSMVLVNYACLKHYCDAVVLSTIADGVVFLINEGKSRRQDVNEAVNFIKQKNIAIIGAVLNNRTFVIPKAIYKLT
jgi:capsular exopolysaccharide synthesis family protein